LIKKYKVPDGYRINVKRLYLPITLESVCPSCGEKKERLLDETYLSYPVTGENQEIGFYCRECDDAKLECEWDVNVRLSIFLEVNDE
jgi:hypothetical protein